MRVVTLLPAATEMVAALGGAGSLTGISHECDYPPSVQHLPRITTTAVDTRASSGAIDAEVRRLRQAGRPVIAIDADALRRLSPDLIITQGLCEVCAVSEGQSYRLVQSLPNGPRVLALTATSLKGIWADIHAVGAALDLEAEADELVLGLRSRLRRLAALPPVSRRRVVCIEWIDPLYLGGHWVPELVAAAGGEDVGARPGDPSSLADWRTVELLDPDHLVVMLCGFGVERALEELEDLSHPEILDSMRRIPTWVIDGNAYTSRPGPRVVDGAALIRSALEGIELKDVVRWQPTLVR